MAFMMQLEMSGYEILMMLSAIIILENVFIQLLVLNTISVLF